jgi:chemosensory pili system protein ChpA (sensor histidine kinase/response regulator)
VDTDILHGFVEEANSYLPTIRHSLRSFAANHMRLEELKVAHRQVHTISGAASMVGLSNLSRRALDMEDRLEFFIHDGGLSFNDEALNAFLAQLEGIESELDALHSSGNGASPAHETDFSAWPPAAETNGATHHEPPPSPSLAANSADPDLLEIFAEEAGEYLEAIGGHLATLRARPGDAEALRETRRYAHTLKGSAAMMGLPELSKLSKRLEETCDRWREENQTPTPELLELFEAAAGVLRQLAGGAEPSALADELQVLHAQFDYAQAAPPPVEEPPVVASPPAPEESVLLDLPLWPSEPARGDAADILAVLSETETTTVMELPLPVAENAPETRADETGFDPDMLEVFRLEAEEHIQNLSQNLETLSAEPGHSEALREISRSAHTLKGSAAMVGLDKVSGLAHRMEDLLEKLHEGDVQVTPEVVALLLSSTETLDALARNVQDPAVEDQRADLQTRYAAMLAGTPEEAAAALETDFAFVENPPESAEDAAHLAEGAFAFAGGNAAKTQGGRVIRVPLARLDEAVKLVSEMLINRSMLEQKLTDMERQVQELRLSTARLQRASHRLEADYEASTLGGGAWLNKTVPTGALPPLPPPADETAPPGARDLFRQSGSWNNEEFDELEFDRYTEFHRLSRELAETSGDTEAISQDCTLLLQDLDGLVLRQRRLVNELQESLMHLRMVPLGTLAPRLRRVVQVSAQQLGKSAELALEGEQIEMDTLVLDALTDPLLHLLRNAVAHGIEEPDARGAQGKPATGAIRLSAAQEGTEIIFRISDDGNGLNLDAIRAKALANGVVTPEELAEMSDEQVSSLIFLPGFTTASEVSQVAGRGVGMDVIQVAVTQLKGVITIDSVPGAGTIFTIRVPVALAVTRALVVRDCGETFAMPLNSVLRALTLNKSQTEQRDGRTFMRHENETYPVVRLGELLKLSGAPENRSVEVPALLIKSGDYAVALALDDLGESRDIVLKSLGAHLGRVPLILGATILGDGQVVPILNPVELVQQAATGSLQLRAAVRPRPVAKRTLTVMMVDDSPSVRRIMSNLVKSQDWTPLPAKDGFDALEILQQAEAPPDIILLDMEMPRMDGYELLAALRSQAAWADIPAVMITSRAGDKHRRKAMELGASDYLVKPYQDETLCAVIRRLTQK